MQSIDSVGKVHTKIVYRLSAYPASQEHVLVQEVGLRAYHPNIPNSERKLQQHGPKTQSMALPSFRTAGAGAVQHLGEGKGPARGPTLNLGPLRCRRGC